MSRMFKSITRTWNVFKGCKHDCVYCCARSLAETRLKNSPRYRDGFEPHFIEEELQSSFRPNEFIFVAFMGDIAFATREEYLRILARIRQFPKTWFLIQSKNPRRLYDWWVNWGIGVPNNVYLGTTIETNRDYATIRNKAPAPIDRFRYLAGYPHSLKFLSIEPIMDFDVDELLHWVKLMQPSIVEVGADNYHNHLPEPSWRKVQELLREAREICPRVVEKDGLERLKEANS